MSGIAYIFLYSHLPTTCQRAPVSARHGSSSFCLRFVLRRGLCIRMTVFAKNNSSKFVSHEFKFSMMLIAFSSVCTNSVSQCAYINLEPGICIDYFSANIAFIVFTQYYLECGTIWWCDNICFCLRFTFSLFSRNL